MPVDAAYLLEFLRRHRLAVQASVSDTYTPQAAVIGYAVTDGFELVFDTLASSRKAHNLRANNRIALVIGGTLDGDEQTVQYEGIADEPTGAELEQLKQLYYGVYPDGPSRLSWPGLIYVRVQPACDSLQQLQYEPTGDCGVHQRAIGRKASNVRLKAETTN